MTSTTAWVFKVTQKRNVYSFFCGLIKKFKFFIVNKNGEKLYNAHTKHDFLLFAMRCKLLKIVRS